MMCDGRTTFAQSIFLVLVGGGWTGNSACGNGARGGGVVEKQAWTWTFKHERMWAFPTAKAHM